MDDGAVSVDVATQDAHVCDPSVLADAGEDDAAGAADGPYVIELSVNSQRHQCARMSDGTVRCQGFNYYGQLGIGSDDALRHDSATVPGLTDVEQVVTGNPDNTCTRHRDGTVRCWGSNEFDLLGTGHTADELCHAFTVGYRCRRTPTLVPGLTDVVHLTAGTFSFCAVRRDGSVWCWGATDALLPRNGSPTPVQVTGLADVGEVWSRQYGWIARLRSGHYTTQPELRGLEIPTDAEIADGPDGYHFCFRLPDSSVRCFGFNQYGKVGNGGSSWPDAVRVPWDPGLCGVRSIVTGPYHTCAVLADRSVRCWGDGEYGGLGAAATDECVAFNYSRAECLTHPTAVAGIDRVDRLFAGVWGTCALRIDHTVWCWGSLAPNHSETPTSIVW